MKTEHTIKNFKKHLERLGFSQNMISQLPHHVKDFLSFIEKEIREVEPGDVMSFYHHLQQRPNKNGSGGLSESYINHHVYGLKVFFKWQQEKGEIIENPMSSLTFPRPKSKPREILSLDEIKELYNACQTLREKAILGLFYGCGLRRSEGEQLNIKDVHFRSGLLYVREGKGKKRRAVPMSEKVKKHLKAYAYKERYAKEHQQAFITGVTGVRLHGNAHQKILKSILERTSIKKQITLHSLRHSIATHLLEKGLSIEYVRDFLGHKHLETTQVYTRINKRQLWNL